MACEVENLRDIHTLRIRSQAANLLRERDPGPAAQPTDQSWSGGSRSAGACANGKFCDHPPLHRQAEIFARIGIDLDRSTLAG
jgi:hypothetical protein